MVDADHVWEALSLDGGEADFAAMSLWEVRMHLRETGGLRRLRQHVERVQARAEALVPVPRRQYADGMGGIAEVYAPAARPRTGADGTVRTAAGQVARIDDGAANIHNRRSPHSSYGCRPPCPDATDPPAPVRLRAELWAMRTRLAWTLPGRWRRAQVAARTGRFTLSYVATAAAVCIPAALAEVPTVVTIWLVWLMLSVWLLLGFSPLRPNPAED
jgi:hypothetical protein